MCVCVCACPCMHLTCARCWLSEELCTHAHRMIDQKHKVLRTAFPLCPPPGEGGTEKPPRAGPCCAEEDLPSDTEETLWASLLHEEAHNEGKGTTTVEGGELSWCGYLSILTVTPHCHPSLSPLTVTPHCHPSLSPLTVTTTSLSVRTSSYPMFTPLTITPSTSPSQEARTRCGVMYEVVTGIPKVSRHKHTQSPPQPSGSKAHTLIINVPCTYTRVP